MSVREAWFRLMLTVLDGYRGFIHSPFDAPTPTATGAGAGGKAAASSTPLGSTTISPAMPPTPSSTTGTTVIMVGGGVGAGGVSAGTPYPAPLSPTGHANVLRSMSLTSGPTSAHERGASGGGGPAVEGAGEDAPPAAIGWYDTAGFVAATKSRRLRAFRTSLVSTQSWQG